MPEPVAASRRPGRSGPRSTSSRARLATPGTTRWAGPGGATGRPASGGAVPGRPLGLRGTALPDGAPPKCRALAETKRDGTILKYANTPARVQIAFLIKGGHGPVIPAVI